MPRSATESGIPFIFITYYTFFTGIIFLLNPPSGLNYIKGPKSGPFDSTIKEVDTPKKEVEVKNRHKFRRIKDEFTLTRLAEKPYGSIF